jgi:glycerophosphoryl diester phosphodiesterase
MMIKRLSWLIGLSASFLLVMVQPSWGQMITGHRGASHDAPENTLAAFQLAWQQGADAVEGDFYLTADRQIVCIHDADTLRTTGIKKVVAQTTLADLRKLDAGSWKGEDFSGEQIPTFAEVLAIIPKGKRFVVELKIGPEIVPVLAEELNRFKPDPASLQIIAFNADTIAACKQQLPEIEAHWLTSFKQKNGIGRWVPNASEIAQTIAQTGADGVGMKGERKVIDSQFISVLKAQGVADFHVWTIDSIDDARYFRDLGAIGITTNRPEKIRQGLISAE